MRLPLYDAEQRRRRDTSRWTIVQGVLAPIQFAIFLASLALVLRYLATGQGHDAATISVVVKTLALYVIMITGCLWEKAVLEPRLGDGSSRSRRSGRRNRNCRASDLVHVRHSCLLSFLQSSC